MEKIDIQNFKKYHLNNDGNATLARVGHVNYVIDGLTEKIIEVINQEVDTQNNILITGTDSESGLNKINNYAISVQGTKFDTYSLQAFTALSGSNLYIIPIGFITTSSLATNIGSSSSSTVIANDSVLQDLISPLGVGALVTDGTGSVFPINFMGINVDNTITTPDEHYIFLIASDTSTFKCSIAINIEAIVFPGSTIEYNVL